MSAESLETTHPSRVLGAGDMCVFFPQLLNQSLTQGCFQGPGADAPIQAQVTSEAGGGGTGHEQGPSGEGGPGSQCRSGWEAPAL